MQSYSRIVDGWTAQKSFKLPDWIMNKQWIKNVAISIAITIWNRSNYKIVCNMNIEYIQSYTIYLQSTAYGTNGPQMNKSTVTVSECCIKIIFICTNGFTEANMIFNWYNPYLLLSSKRLAVPVRAFSINSHAQLKRKHFRRCYLNPV